MKKRILSIIIVLSLAFAGFPANANALSDNIGMVFEKLAEFTPQDRENIITIIYPLLIVDSGIDALVKIIDEHEGADSSMFGEYIELLLKHVSKEDAKVALLSIKIIPEKIRNEYFSAFVNREEISMSASSVEKFGKFMEVIYDEFPDLEKILKEDNISEKTIAKFMVFITAANVKPIIKADSDYKFSFNKLSSVLKENEKKVSEECGKDLSIEEGITKFTAIFNAKLSYSVRKDVSSVLEELGICYIEREKDDPAGGSTGSTGTTPGSDAVIVDKVPENEVFKDIEGWYKPYILSLNAAGIVSGRGDGMFYPNDSVTREEFVKMICLAVGFVDVDEKTAFTDVDNNAWYAKYINTAYKNGIINGQSAEIFGIGKNISRQDASVICSNVIGNKSVEKVAEIVFKDQLKISPYAKESVYKLAEIGILNGDNLGNFNPHSNLTRGESAKIICELMRVIGSN